MSEINKKITSTKEIEKLIKENINLNSKLNIFNNDSVGINEIANNVLYNGINVENLPTSLSPLVGDGVTDDSANLQAIFDYAKNNNIGRIYFPRSDKVYYLGETAVNINSDIEVIGCGSKITGLNHGNGNLFIKDGGKNIKIHGLKLETTFTSADESQAGCCIWIGNGCSNIDIYGNYFNGNECNTNAGIRIYASSTKNINIHDNFATELVFLTENCSNNNNHFNFNINNNILYDCYNGIGLNSPVKTKTDYIGLHFTNISNNVITLKQESFTKQRFCIDLASCYCVNVNNNICIPSLNAEAIHTEDASKSINIIGNNIFIPGRSEDDANWKCGINVMDGINHIIENNIITYTGDGRDKKITGISVNKSMLSKGCKDVIVKDNKIINCGRGVYSTRGSENCKVISNYISDSEYGIYFGDAYHYGITIRDNIIEKSSYGLYFKSQKISGLDCKNNKFINVDEEINGADSKIINFDTRIEKLISNSLPETIGETYTYTINLSGYTFINKLYISFFADPQSPAYGSATGTYALSADNTFETIIPETKVSYFSDIVSSYNTDTKILTITLTIAKNSSGNNLEIRHTITGDIIK